MTAPVRDPSSSHATVGDRLIWRNIILITFIAILAMGPELAIGLTITDNYRFNLLWPEQFGELFRSQHAYPRWLPRAWAGLGAPVFYFYPPFFFWISSIIDAVTGGLLGPERFVPLANTVALLASGVAMRAWLRPLSDERSALIGALVYMLAPYHLYDIYCRGALAEATAYASVPLIMLALSRIAEHRLSFVPVLAASYATLLLSHLPTALLVSVLLIPAYVAVTAYKLDRSVPYLASALAGGLLGIGLVAIYLVPALTLLPFVNADALNQGFYQPDAWFFWKTPPGPMGGRMLFIIPVGIGAALVAAGALFARKPAQAHRTSIFWAMLTLVVFILVAGLFPPFWKLPGLALVQFPWRALMIVEFTAITMLCTLFWRIRGPVMLAGVGIVAIAYAILGLLASHTIGRTVDGQSLTAAQLRLNYLDAPEYTPRGVRISNADDPDRVHVEISKTPLASATDARAILRVANASDGSMAFEINSPVPTTIKLRRHFFPQWRLRDAQGRDVPVIPDPRERIVTFTAPAGTSSMRLEHGTAPNETLGQAISFLALLIVGSIAFLSVRRAAKT